MALVSVLSCDKVRGGEDTPPHDNEVIVELSCGAVLLYNNKPSPSLTIACSEQSRHMEVVARYAECAARVKAGDETELVVLNDTLSFESSEEPFVYAIPFSSKDLNRMSIEAKEFTTDGYVLDTATSDTTFFSFRTMCLPRLTLPVKDITAGKEPSSFRYKVYPADAMEGFKVVSVSDNIKLESVSATLSIGTVSFTTTGVGPAEIVLSYAGYPDYQYRYAFNITGDYIIETGFIRTMSEIEGKVFTKICPEIYLKAGNDVQMAGFPSDLEMRMYVRASGSCDWHDDSAWDDPAVKEKLTSGYHITRHDDFEVCDTLSVTSLGFIGKDVIERRRIFDYNIEDVIYRYRDHISYTGMQVDPVNQVVYPTFINPIPRHYYDCMSFQVILEPACRYPYLHFTAHYDWNYQLYPLVSDKAFAETKDDILDQAGMDTLLSWPRALEIEMAPDVAEENKDE